MTRFLTTLVFSLGFSLVLSVLAGGAFAECAGRDLRPTLTPEERAEVARLLDDAPYARGNHWTATRDGEVLHLVGTIHLDDPRLDAPVARLRPIIEQAALLLVEITTEEEGQLQRAIRNDPSLITLENTSLPELMDEETWRALADAAEIRGLPPFMAAKLQPWYLSMLLALPSCFTATVEAGAGLDKRLQRIAEAAGVPTRSLESYRTIFDSFAATPMEEQIEMLSTSLVPAANSEDQFATLLAAYFEQAHLESWVTSRVLARRAAPISPDQADAAFDSAEALLLTARNKAWVPELIDALYRTEGDVIAAFGAGHLGGETGILALLRQEGFILVRQPF